MGIITGDELLGNICEVEMPIVIAEPDFAAVYMLTVSILWGVADS